MKNKQTTIEEQIEKAEQLVENFDVENTPFTVVHFTEKGHYFGALGKYRLTEYYDNRAKAEKEVRRLDWNNIFRVLAVILETYEPKKQ